MAVLKQVGKILNGFQEAMGWSLAANLTVVAPPSMPPSPTAVHWVRPFLRHMLVFNTLPCCRDFLTDFTSSCTDSRPELIFPTVFLFSFSSSSFSVFTSLCVL